MNTSSAHETIKASSSNRIRVLGISGSPRKQATEFVLDNALSTLSGDDLVIEQFNLRTKTIQPCNHCASCDHGRHFQKTGRYCRIEDDMEAFYDKLRYADAILIATPVYGGSVSGQLKCLMDRIRALSNTAPESLRGDDKVGGAITVAGSRHGGQQLAAQDIYRWFMWLSFLLAWFK